MMYGYGFGLWSLVMMLIPMAVLGLVIYWAVYSGVKNAMKNKTPGE
ncbi:MAG: hypothetical protein ACOY30_01345 [Bacillota bacterium]